MSCLFKSEMKNHFSHPLFLKVESLAEPVFYGLEENIDLNRSHNYLVKEMKWKDTSCQQVQVCT
jgi:hypothetical protein